MNNIAMLRSAIWNLSKQSPDALSSVPEHSHRPDELALNFDDVFLAASAELEGRISKSQKQSLDAIDQYLSKMSDRKELWTEEAVARSVEWSSLRKLASAAIESLGWANDV